MGKRFGNSQTDRKTDTHTHTHTHTLSKKEHGEGHIVRQFRARLQME